jgi:hypothetical protein
MGTFDPLKGMLPTEVISALEQEISDQDRGYREIGGYLYIYDVDAPGGVASAKAYQDPPNNTVLQSVTVDQTSVRIYMRSSYPLVTVEGVSGTLTPTGDLFAGYVDITVTPGTGDVVVTATSTNPEGTETATDSVTITVDAGPELLSLSFTGGYPGSQTELKAGDTFDVTGTTDKTATHIEVIDTGAGTSQLIALSSPGTSFTESITIADRGTSPQALAARIKARNAAGAFGSTRDTDAGGGSVDGTDVVTLNNLYPSFVDNGTTFPPAQTAFKGTESGSQDTTVNNATGGVAYTSPHGDFTITAPGTYTQVKAIQCTNPGDYNDSDTNFRIVANRSENDASATFNKTIEVADVAPTITVGQPAARLRSGGNDGTAAQDHVITATSNQNLAAAPDLNLGVAGGGTWQGGGFAGGPKVWTRTLQVHDNDNKGTGGWSLAAPVTNNAGLIANPLTDNQVNGGFVARDLTFAAFQQQTALNTECVDYSKITAGIFTATNQPSTRNPVQGDVTDLTNTYTILVMGVNPSALWWNDVSAAASNSSGTAQLLAIEETV